MTPEDRRRAIIEAVHPLLLTHGPELTTRQIAEAAGVAEGTLFRVFESKQELLAEAACAALHAEPALQQLADLPQKGPARLADRVVAVLGILQAEGRRTRALGVALVRPPDGQAPHRHDYRHTGLRDRRARLTEAVAASLEEYAADLAVPPRTAAQLLLAIAFALTFDPIENHPLTGPGGIADVVLHGIARGTT